MTKLIIISILLLTLSQTASALTLDQAKQQGLVGETPSGYIEPVSHSNQEVTALVNDINSRRKTEYQSIASKNKTSINAVELLAGKKALDKTVPGHYVKINGKWLKK